ncbi:MAG: class I SAM-dependent methyltransferase [Rhizobiaceae bacterium]|nr:class I SAM-dependent methyltransferase [Rhizobiaceae bacterium]
MSNGWNESAVAWVTGLGERGDYGREFVLDRPMLARVDAGKFHNALDVGCGEGRFCRMMAQRGIACVGIDPTEALLAEARRRDPDGRYRFGYAEELPFGDAEFDLVVSYLSLIDIRDAGRAISEMSRVLRPGGTLLIANLNSFITAASPDGWHECADGETRYCFDNYMDERADWVSWRGIRIENWHRPLSTYMKLLLGQGLSLRWFDEPEPIGGDEARRTRYRRAPYFHVMEWRKGG